MALSKTLPEILNASSSSVALVSAATASTAAGRDENANSYYALVGATTGLLNTGYLSGGVNAATTSKTIDSAAGSVNQTFFPFDCSGGGLTCNFPASASNSGRLVFVSKNDSSVNTLTVDLNSSETLLGATTLVLRRQYEGVAVYLDGTGGTVVAYFPGVTPSLLYQGYAASNALSASNTETEWTPGSAYGSRTLAANSLKAGDKIVTDIQGIATATNSTDTLLAKLYLGGTGGTNLATTGAVDVANSDIFIIHNEIDIRTIGASGTAIARGWVGLGASGTVTMKGNFTASFTIDTTTTNAIGVYGTWSTTSASNSARVDGYSIKQERAT